jgi:iron complex outermembrane receptor protein
LNVYQFTGVGAQFYGFEAAAQVQLTNNIAVHGTFSYTHARRKVTELEKAETGQTGDWQPLPMIPPLKGSATVRYASGGFQFGMRTNIAARQTRTGDFETPTDGYTTFGAFGQYRFQTEGMLHTISLNANNILNQTYYNHLSRIKDIMPEPGRNISLLYRLYF